MLKKLIPIALISSFLFSQSIIHSPINNIQEGGSLAIEASMVGMSPSDDITFTVFFRAYGQRSYVYSKMRNQNGVYKFTIPSSFINNNTIEYYIVSEIEGKGFYAFPEIDPDENPILARSDAISNFQNNDNQLQSSGLLQPNYQILSPENNLRLLSEDLLISLSYFKMEDIDHTHTKIYVNDIDYTDRATIRLSHFSIVPNKIWNNGEYKVRVQFRSMSGLEYESVIWKFRIISEETTEKQKLIISQGGNLSGDYNSSYNNGTNLSIGEVSGNYHLNMDWLRFRTNFLLSSLEDPEEQTRHRFSVNFKSSYYDIKLGDFYPDFSEYSIKGARLRGSNIIFQNNFLYLNILSGNLARATQGIPDEAMGLIVNTTSNIQENNFDVLTSGFINVTRDAYTFEQGAFGINLEVMPTEKFKWGLELLKVKDRVMSVEPDVDESVVLLPQEMVRFLYSDIYMIDDETGKKFICNYDEHDVVQSQAYGVANSSFDSFDAANDLDDFDSSSWVSYSQDTIDLGEHSSPWHIANSPIDDIIYITLGGDNLYDTEGVAAVRYTNDNLQLEWESVPQNSSFDTLHGIDVSSDGTKLYVSGRGDGHIHVFNASNGDFLNSVSFGNMSMLGGLAVEKKGVPNLGDTNNDSIFNVVDIVSVVSNILEPMMADPYPAYASDLSEDQIINVVDVVALVQIVLDSN